MKRQLWFISLFLLSTAAPTFAPTNFLPISLAPKREFRGVWVGTVTNLDWPSASGLTPAEQRHELISILDEAKDAGINAVIFQVRPECDAFYPSALEPWSFWLTGQQGKAPDPFYDPLAFAIAEAHKRGMELHAWFNPYRAVREVGVYPNAPHHVTVKHPEWVLNIANIKILDPGLPMVREYITSVIMDVVRRYDVDGIHFDDYFYPYPPNQISSQDAATFANYSRNFTNIRNWRRDNVNLLVSMVHVSIQAVKPHVKFGISPFGIWRNGVPEGISGIDAYNTLYADALAWLNQQTIDYLAPQLYWPFGGGQDYGKLLLWWASQMNGRHLYAGQALHRVRGWPANAMPDQLRLNRSDPNTFGSIFFRALFFRENPKGFIDSLQTDFYRYPALLPSMNWKDAVPPNNPQRLKFERLAGSGSAGLLWDLPMAAADGDTASRYAVYRFDHPAIHPSDLNNPSKIIAIEGQRFSMTKTPPLKSGTHYYLVTALDRNYNESAASNVLLIPPPAQPLLATPANGGIINTNEVALSWYYPNDATSYHLQVARDRTFATQLEVNETGIADTVKIVTGLAGQETYYWRVSASNPSGSSAFSSIGSFTIGLPTIATLVSPMNSVRDVPTDPTLIWKPARGANSYRLQLATSSLFDSLSLLSDASGIADTAYAVSQLRPDTFHFWRVRAENAVGVGDWTMAWRFKTVDATAVAEALQMPTTYELYQNYPNPFNPATTIAFALPAAGAVQLLIYDSMGREIARLIDEPMAAGRHEAYFDALQLASGVYYFRLNFEGKFLTKKMIFVP